MNPSRKLARMTSLAALTAATLALPVAAQDMNRGANCQPKAAAKCGAQCAAKKCAPKCGAKN